MSPVFKDFECDRSFPFKEYKKCLVLSNVSDRFYDSCVDKLKNLHLLSVFVVFVWTSSPPTCIPSMLFSFTLAFTLYLKYMALIECVINREDKGNYKSLNLHFISGF